MEAESYRTWEETVPGVFADVLWFESEWVAWGDRLEIPDLVDCQI